MASVPVVAPRAASFPRGVYRRARHAAPVSTHKRHRHFALAFVPSPRPSRTERRARDARVSASKMETAVRGLDDAVCTSLCTHIPVSATPPLFPNPAAPGAGGPWCVAS